MLPLQLRRKNISDIELRYTFTKRHVLIETFHMTVVSFPFVCLLGFCLFGVFFVLILILCCFCGVYVHTSVRKDYMKSNIKAIKYLLLHFDHFVFWFGQ